jgi:mRNA interferase MazF
MKLAGQVVLFRFPQTDLISGKLRPALLIQRAPGPHDDWLICMISSQTQQFIPDFDEIVEEDSEDFAKSGLKVPSVIRIGRLAVVDGTVLLGVLGEISMERLHKIRNRLAAWLMQQ